MHTAPTPAEKDILPPSLSAENLFEFLSSAVSSIFNRFCPLGIAFLLAGRIVKMKDIEEIGQDVAMYALTVIVGLVIHSFFTLPLIHVTVTHKNPLRYMSGLLHVLTTAFGTSSR